jgi:hypothetical protein
MFRNWSVNRPNNSFVEEIIGGFRKKKKLISKLASKTPKNIHFGTKPAKNRSNYTNIIFKLFDQFDRPGLRVAAT